VWKSGAKDFVADQNLMATSAKKNRWDGWWMIDGCDKPWLIVSWWVDDGW
jgi:hypothetical protein